mmetsp:Transcript_71091/g.141257  ORF Transcript_71091/g.141257 Transcript_71091/m.141257 type:complete len:217 (-) Transcript_71091:147-797(-)
MCAMFVLPSATEPDSLGCKAIDHFERTESDPDTPVTAISGTNVWGRLYSECETWVSEITNSETVDNFDASEHSSPQECNLFKGVGDDQRGQLGKDVEREQGWRGTCNSTQDAPEDDARSLSLSSRNPSELQMLPQEPSEDMVPEELPCTQQLEPTVLVGESLWNVSAESAQALSAEDSMRALPKLFEISCLSTGLFQGSCGRRPHWEATKLYVGTK